MKRLDPAQYIPPVPPGWVLRFAQVGLAAKGVVYFLTGVLALLGALGLGSGEAVSKRAVFLRIEELFFGTAVLLLVALGLACYSFWRLLQALADTEGKGAGIRAAADRVRYAASGAFYGLLALVAGELAVEGGGRRGIRQALLEQVLQRPLGPWLVMLAAAAVALGGAYFIYQGLSGRYRKKIKGTGLKQEAVKGMIRGGMIGYVARGTVWIIVGYLFLRASLDATVHGAGNAFRFLENAPHGSYLLGGIAVGLICYSLFVFMEAKFWQSKK